jgi:hypothetical protein
VSLGARESARQLPHALPQFLIRGMRVHDRCQRTRVPREPLGEEQISRCPVDIRDRRVPKRVEGVEAIEAGLDLEVAEEDLNPTLRDLPAG